MTFLLDTNILIDGRIAGLLAFGLFEGFVFVPRYVLDELRKMADSESTERRQKGLKGLEVAEQLVGKGSGRVAILETGAEPAGHVDAMILATARAMGARLITNDRVLAMAARAEGLNAVSMYEIYTAVRPVYTIGQEILVVLTDLGKDRGQATAHMEDGTMVVVDGAASMIGREVTAVITNFITTATGAIVFARVKG